MTQSTYGQTGAGSLVAAALLWAVAVLLADTGTNPGGLTRGIGLLSLLLLAAGMAALVKMMIEIYGDEEL